MKIANLWIVQNPQCYSTLEDIFHAQPAATLHHWILGATSIVLGLADGRELDVAYYTEREEALVAQLPSPYSERWETMPDDPAARRRAMRKVFLAAFAVSVALVGAGTAAWQIAGDTDYLVAGLCYGAVVGVAAGAAYLVIARRQPRR